MAHTTQYEGTVRSEAVRLKGVESLPESGNDRLIVIRAQSVIGVWDYIREICIFREFLVFLIWRDLTIRYRRTVIGIGWVIFQPVFQAVLLWWIFARRIFSEQADGLYALQVFGGTTMWLYGSNSILAAIHHLSTGGNLITKVYFPRALLALSPCVMYLLDLAICSGILMVGIGYCAGISWAMLWLPICYLGVFCSTVGPALVVGILAARYRDVKHIAPYFLQLWIFATPGIYLPFLMVTGSRNLLISLFNPLQAWVSCVAYIIRGTSPPVELLMIGFLVSVSTCLAGLWIFLRLERNLADHL